MIELIRMCKMGAEFWQICTIEKGILSVYNEHNTWNDGLNQQNLIETSKNA